MGPGGLRDIEFSVQLLQLVHGRSDVLIRSSNTIDALRALAMWGYVGREEASQLEHSYRFLRTLEHRIQLRHLRRTHIVPQDPDELRVIARSMGITSNPIDTLISQWGSNRADLRPDSVALPRLRDFVHSVFLTRLEPCATLKHSAAV